MLGLAVAATCAIALFAHSESGAKWAVNKLVRSYGASIEGSVSVEHVEGSLAEGIEINALMLRDREGRPLYAMQDLSLDLATMAALRGELRDVELKVRGVSVVLPADGEPGFADLKPRARSEEEAGGRQAREGEGPSFELRVDLSDIRVHRRERPDQTLEQAQTLGRLERAQLNMTSEDGRGQLSVGLAMNAPALDGLEVRDFQGKAAWEGELVTVGPLTADTSWGGLGVDRLLLNTRDKSIEFENTHVEIDRAFFARRTGLALTQSATIDAHGRLGIEGTDFTLVGELAEAGSFRARVEAHHDGAFGIEYDAQAELPLADWQPSTSLEAIALGLHGSVKTVGLGTWHFEAALDCRGCETGKLEGQSPEGSVHVDATMSAFGAGSQAHLTAALAGSELDLHLDSSNESEPRITGSMNRPQDQRFEAWLGRLGLVANTPGPKAVPVDCGGGESGVFMCLVGTAQDAREVPLSGLHGALAIAAGAQNTDSKL